MSTGRLIVNRTELDLSDRIPFPLNYSIADLTNPEKRKRNFSRSVKLPGTQKNMNFFSSTYSLSLTTVDNTSLIGFDFDPTIRVEAKYYKRSTLVFDGLIQVNKVIIENDSYFFECTLFSDFVDLYTVLKDIEISELGWSEYDHELTRENVKNSWDTSVIVDGAPVSNFTSGKPDSFGYLYGLADYGFPKQSPTTYKTADIIPLVYFREVFEKCLNLTGITYQSNWLDSELIKKLVIGFGGGPKPSLSAPDIAQREVNFDGNFSAVDTKSYSSSQFIPGIGPIPAEYRLTFPTLSNYNLFQNSNFTENIIQDTLSQYDPITGEIEVALSGQYRIELSGVLNLVLNTGSMSIVENGGINGFRVVRNGSLIQNSLVNFNGFGNVNIQKVVDLDLLAGDVLKVEFFFNGNVKTTVSDISLAEPIQLTVSNITNLEFKFDSIQTTIGDNSLISLSRFIPKMKASQFLSDAIKIGNLMISDPDVFGVVTIEPVEDYYQNTDVFDDITNLVDYKKPIEIIPPSNIIKGKTFKFRFKKDQDYDNKRYFDVFQIGYGDYDYRVESTFQTGDKTYQLGFAQTIPVDIINTTLVVPRIIQYDENTGTTKPYKGSPRIYFYNGLKGGNWRLTNTDNTNSFDNLNQYPSLHHLDDYENPSFDLNFGVPELLYYAATAYTTDNIFSRYHERFVKEITGRDSKIVRLHILENADRINKRDFSVLKMWNGVLFRLNQIKDFDEDVEQSTEIEIVRILKANSPRRKSVGPSIPIDNKNVEIISGGQNNDNSGVGIISGGFNSDDSTAIIIKNQ